MSNIATCSIVLRRWPDNPSQYKDALEVLLNGLFRAPQKLFEAATPERQPRSDIITVRSIAEGHDCASVESVLGPQIGDRSAARDEFVQLLSDSELNRFAVLRNNNRTLTRVHLVAAITQVACAFVQRDSCLHLPPHPDSSVLS